MIPRQVIFRSRWWSDSRRMLLASAITPTLPWLSRMHLADGHMAELWRVCLEQGTTTLSVETIERYTQPSFADALKAAGLAEQTTNKIEHELNLLRICGVDAELARLRQTREARAEAGRKSGESRAKGGAL